MNEVGHFGSPPGSIPELVRSSSLSSALVVIHQATSVARSSIATKALDPVVEFD